MSKKNHLRGLDRQIREKSPVINKILDNFENDDDSDFSVIESAVYGNDDSGFDIDDVEDMTSTLEEYSQLDDDDDEDDYDDYSDEDDDLIEGMKDDDYDDEDESEDDDDETSRLSKRKKKKCKDEDCDEDDCDDAEESLFMDEEDIDLGYESVLKPAKNKKIKRNKYKAKEEDEDDGLDPDLDEDSDDPDLDYMEGAEECNFESALATVDFGEVMKAVNLFNDEDVVTRESLSVVEGIDDGFYNFIDDEDL